MLVKILKKEDIVLRAECFAFCGNKNVLCDGRFMDSYGKF
jgi:hypothetical protein